jgi:excinuclease ABC subunit B
VGGKGGIPQSELKKIISEIEKEMKGAAQNLEFEKAALLRDQMYELRTIMAEESNAPPWKKIHILAGEDVLAGEE